MNEKEGNGENWAFLCVLEEVLLHWLRAEVSFVSFDFHC